MKQLIKRCIFKIVFAIILCTIFSIIMSSFAPHFTNDLALGQLENDDMSWSIMNIWYQVQNYTWCVYAIIGLTVTISVGKDFLKFIKMKEEE